MTGKLKEEIKIDTRESIVETANRSPEGCQRVYFMFVNFNLVEKMVPHISKVFDEVMKEKDPETGRENGLQMMIDKGASAHVLSSIAERAIVKRLETMFDINIGGKGPVTKRILSHQKEIAFSLALRFGNSLQFSEGKPLLTADSAKLFIKENKLDRLQGTVAGALIFSVDQCYAKAEELSQAYVASKRIERAKKRVVDYHSACEVMQ